MRTKFAPDASDDPRSLFITFGGDSESGDVYACVAARRSDHHWVVTSEEYPHVCTQARLLASAGEFHRASLAAAVGVPEWAVTAMVYPELPTHVHELLELWEKLQELARGYNHAAAKAHQAIARALASEHHSLRDIGTILGVSFQRAHQLLTNHGERER